MQLALEEKEFVYDREARKAAYTTNQDFFDHWLTNIVGEGRAVSQQTTGVSGDASGQSLLNTNPAKARQDAATEATGQVVARLEQSENLHKEVQAAAAQAANDNSNVENSTKSTLTKEEQDKLLNPKSTSDEEFMELALKTFDNPNNTTAGAAFQAINTRNKLAGQKIADEKAEYLASGGWHSIRRCIAWVLDGQICDEWKIVAPASFVAYITQNLGWQSLAFLFNAHELGEDFPKPSIDEEAAKITDLTGENQTGQTPATAQDTCPGPEPCPDTGWQPGTTDFNFSESLIQEIINSGSGGGAGGGGGPGTGIPSIPFDLNFPPPSISVFDADPQPDGTWLVRWETQNAIFCQAINDWDGSQPAVNAGAVLGVNESRTTGTIIGRQEYQLACFNIDLEGTERALIFQP
jgi:hypothetical protein